MFENIYELTFYALSFFIFIELIKDLLGIRENRLIHLLTEENTLSDESDSDESNFTPFNPNTYSLAHEVEFSERMPLYLGQRQYNRATRTFDVIINND